MRPGLPIEALRTLLAVTDHGSFEAAAAHLRVTQPAVSQRVKALEQRVGRVLVIRSKPLRLTESGATVARFARQMLFLEQETASALGMPDAGEGTSGSSRLPVRLAIAVNADSLASWFLDALTAVPPALRACFELHREDQERTSELLRSGVVCAAVTADPRPVDGCTIAPLGQMTYRALASPRFAARWVGGKPLDEALAAAPVVIFDRDDDLQHRFTALLRPGAEPSGLRHYVPVSESYLRAVELGMGWGMVPDELASRLPPGSVTDLAPGTTVRVALYWQQWKLDSGALTALSDAVVSTAARSLER